MTHLIDRSDAVRSAIVEADWNFWNADTGYLTHAAHRYSGKFIPQIAGQAIELLSKPGDLIVDPYCGSGTTLVEAGIRGRRALGVDMNPLAILIASVKITPVDPPLLRAFCARMQQLIEGLEADDLFRRAPLSRDEDDPRLHDVWFMKWFQPPVLHDLIAIHNDICDEKDVRLRNIGLTAFSDILRRASNAHQGYPNVMFDRSGGSRPRPGRPFLKALRKLADAVAMLGAADRWDTLGVRLGDARHLPLDHGAAQAVVTHPPYVGSIPYAEYGALSLKWLGHDPRTLDRALTGGQRQSKHILERFTIDYAAMIAEAYRVTCSGGYLFILVGHPTIKGALVDLTQMTVEHAVCAGYREVAHATRSAENRRANKMGDETLLTFQRA